MDHHPLANLFKRSNYDEHIASELSALDYLYEVFLEIRESENCDEVLKEEIYEVIHDSSLNENHDCNGVTIYSINVNCANNMQNPKLGMLILICPLLIAMIMIGVITFLMILKNCLCIMMNMLLIIMLALILKVGLERS